MSKQTLGLLKSLKRKHYYQMQAQGEEEDLKGSVPSLVLEEYWGSPTSSVIILLFAFKLLRGKHITQVGSDTRGCWGGAEHPHGHQHQAVRKQQPTSEDSFSTFLPPTC